MRNLGRENPWAKVLADFLLELGDPLSPRKIQVAASPIEGKGNKTIAAEMGIAPRTAKLYVRNLVVKLGAINRTAVPPAERQSTIQRGGIDSSDEEIG